MGVARVRNCQEGEGESREIKRELVSAMNAMMNITSALAGVRKSDTPQREPHYSKYRKPRSSSRLGPLVLALFPIVLIAALGSPRSLEG